MARHLPGGRTGTATAVLAVATVQAVAFAAAHLAGRPTLYAAFAVLSAAALAYAADRGAFGVAAAALGTGLLVAIGLPLVLFAARQQPAAVLEQAASAPVRRAIFLAVYGPLLAAAVGLLLGVPLAWQLARGFPGRALVESLVDLPLVVPHSVAGLVVLFGFGGGGLFPRLEVQGTMAGMVIALTFVSAPFAVNASREAFETVDQRLEYAARVHGANRLETFRRVTGPLAARGMVTGGVLAWARAVSEFGAVAIVAYNVSFFYPPAGGVVTGQHAPVLVYTAYTTEGLAAAGAVAFLLLVVALALFLAVRLAVADREVGFP